MLGFRLIFIPLGRSRLSLVDRSVTDCGSDALVLAFFLVVLFTGPGASGDTALGVSLEELGDRVADEIGEASGEGERGGGELILGLLTLAFLARRDRNFSSSSDDG
jgi:hypothetical protein